MKVKIKKLHTKAVIPKYAKDGDAGMDLTAVEAFADAYYITYRTGLSIEIPPGYVGLLFPRSSVYKKGQILSNSVGVIDSGYTGEVFVNCINVTRNEFTISKGSKLPFQLVVVKCDNEFEVVSEEEYLNLSRDSSRKEGKVGSSD